MCIYYIYIYIYRCGDTASRCRTRSLTAGHTGRCVPRTGTQWRPPYATASRRRTGVAWVRSGAWCTPFWFGARPFFRRIESAALPRLARVVGAWQPCCSGCPYMYRCQPMSFPTDQRAFDHASVDADDSKIPVPYHDHSRPANRGIISPFCATSWWEAPEWGQACDCSGETLREIQCYPDSPDDDEREGGFY